MSRRGGFGRALLFAGGAGLGTFAAWAATGGYHRSYLFALLWLVPSYLFFVAPKTRGAVGASALLLCVSIGLWMLGTSPAILGLVNLLALGLLRSLVLYPSERQRALVVEAMLLGGGLAFSMVLAGTGPFDDALAAWGFFLVQSGFALVGARDARPSSERRDPFDAANTRAQAILDELG